MCGIAGIISPYPSLVQMEKLQLMTDSLQHRGPDGEGFYKNEEGTVALGHRRLSIIDLSENASQPFHYLHYILVFNGAIYNYVELKDELRTKGYTFTTLSDTEIISAAYDCWGKDCLLHFDGMFAFAIYNTKEQLLFVARDWFGEKPLYYYSEHEQRGRFKQFGFASEMKALWAMGLPRQLNGTQMLNYLTLGYVQNPIKKTDTFFSNILSLPPGHYLTVLPSQGRVQMRRWYVPVKANKENGNWTNRTEAETIEKFSELFFTSVKRRLRCDVTLGTSLSGGLDSASIAAAIHSQTHSSFPVFTASFSGFEKDESARSKETADHFSLQQHLISPTANDWVNNWQQLMYHQEEPMQSSSVLTQFLVYGLAKEKGITVLLDGQGADEILGGYQKYPQWYLQQLLRTDRKAFYKEKKLLHQHQFLDHWNWKNYAASFFPEKVAMHLQQRDIHHQNQHPFLQSDFLRQYQNADTLQKPEVRQLEDLLFYNTFQVGLQELLRYADRNSMAHSREVRLPFLNHELVEFVFSLPSSYKIKEGFTKWILRKSMEQLLPSDMVWSNGKIGYEPPQQLWMQQAPIQEMIHEARKTLVSKFILKPGILEESIQARPAHAKDNFDWRYLCAAELFNAVPKTF